MDNLFIELKSKIENAENIAIISHVNPDGDTLGSNLALSIVIDKIFKKNVDSLFAGHLPAMYSFLPEFYRFKNVNDVLDKHYDLVIAVDVAAKDRMLVGSQIFDAADYNIVIDHHKTNVGFGKLNIIEADAACVGVTLYKIFKFWNIEISTDVARCIYASLLTDTGGFKYENTTPETFELAADLVRLGVSPMKEYRACYETKPQSMVQFQSYVVSNAKFYSCGKIALAKISKEDMKKFNASEYFTEGIVETLRTSKSVEISAVIRETEEGYAKVSLRSKTLDVTSIVTDFGGGGHAFAAGCTIKKPLNIAVDKLLERIQSELF